MKNASFKKNGMGKYALDFMSKKVYIKTATRKNRAASKKACKTVN